MVSLLKINSFLISSFPLLILANVTQAGVDLLGDYF